jgi:hypothetical protein
LVDGAGPFQLRSHRPRQRRVGAGQYLQMEVRLRGDLGAQRVDDRQPGAPALGAPDAAHEVHVRHRRVVAPHDVEPGMLGEFRRAAGHRAIGAGPGFAAHPAAQGAPVELARAEPVEEARRHAVAGEETVRPGIVQRQYRLCSPAADNLSDPVVDLVERRVPRDPLELPGTFRSNPAQRVQQALRPMHEGFHPLRDFGADDPSRVRRRGRTAHLHDAALIDRDTDAARIRAIKGADAGALFKRHGSAPRRLANEL